MGGSCAEGWAALNCGEAGAVGGSCARGWTALNEVSAVTWKHIFKNMEADGTRGTLWMGPTQDRASTEEEEAGGGDDEERATPGEGDCWPGWAAHETRFETAAAVRQIRHDDS